jgi:hypothetical protein
MIIRDLDLRDLHKQHFACFDCRKAFKQRGSEGSATSPEPQTFRPFPCPECGRSMAVMGRDFEAPPQRDRTGWLVAQLLQSFGVIFEPGMIGPGERPRRVREAIAFLVKKGHDARAVERRARELRQPDEQQGPA